MKRGDIVLLPFPFTDFTGRKDRPALILISGPDDVTVSFITTQMKWIVDGDVTLEPTLGNGLKRTSLVRLGKLATVDRDLIIGKLGELGADELKKVELGLLQIFQLN